MTSSDKNTASATFHNDARRKFLRSAAWSIALPLLPSLAPRKAWSATAPKRLVFWWTPDGIMPAMRGAGDGGEDFNGEPGRWTPNGTDFTPADFTFPLLSANLKDVKNDIIMVRGIDTGFLRAAGCPHDVGPRFNFTGNGPDSIDMLIGEKMTTRFKQMQIGVATWGLSRADSRIHYRNNAPVQPINNPNTVFQNLFGNPDLINTPMLDNQLLLTQKRKKSVWDSVLTELQDVRSKLGALDKKNLEYYEESVREAERSLGSVNDAMPASLDGICKKPVIDLSSIKSINNFNPEMTGDQLPNYDKVAELQAQLLILALQCDQTRVATLMFEKGRTGQRFNFIGVNNGNHYMAHRYYRDEQSTREFEKVPIWRAKMFADFVKKLKATPDVDGQMLIENIAVIHTTELSTPGHGFKNLPIVVAGRFGGLLRTGRLIDFSAAKRESQLSLYLTFARMMGVDLPQFPVMGGPYVKTASLGGWK